MHDLVKGVEDLRTTLQTGLEIEQGVRGATAGFNTPTLVVDAPGGGGKRDAHSYEHYDRTTGVSVFTAPAVHPGETYFYFDPIDLLPPEGQARWADPAAARRHGRRSARRGARVAPLNSDPLSRVERGEGQGEGPAATSASPAASASAPRASACARRSSGAS